MKGQEEFGGEWFPFVFHEKADGLIVVVDHPCPTFGGLLLLAEHTFGHDACGGRPFHLAGGDGLFHKGVDEEELFVVLRQRLGRNPRPTKVEVDVPTNSLHGIGQGIGDAITLPSHHAMLSSIGFDMCPKIGGGHSFREWFLIFHVTPVFVMAVYVVEYGC